MKRIGNSSGKAGMRVFVVALGLLAGWTGLDALATDAQEKHRKPSQVEASLQDYLVRVRTLGLNEPHTPGSLWTPSSQLSETATDYKARRTGDLLVINLVDNFSATTNGQSAQQRTFNASSGLSSSLIGNSGTAGKLANIFSPSSTQTLSGKGQSALSSTISLNLSARVVDTLPNGVLVVEAVRDLTVGDDRQTIVLHGLVRPGDIASDNSVPSSAIANLEARVHGKGVVADAIRQPNALTRFLMKVTGF